MRQESNFVYILSISFFYIELESDWYKEKKLIRISLDISNKILKKAYKRLLFWLSSSVQFRLK